MTVDGEERRLVDAVWAELTTADPGIVASLYQESPEKWALLVGQCLSSARLPQQDFGGQVVP
jgi:hypothetical protein